MKVVFGTACIAGFTILTITLVYLIRQTEGMSKDLMRGAYDIILKNMIFVDEIFIKYPKMRPYFYQNKDIDKDDSDYNRIVAIAELILDFLDSVFLQKEYFKSIYPLEWWEDYAKFLFANSPVLCRCLDSVDGWYSKELVSVRKEVNKNKNNNQQNEVVDAI